MGTINTGNFGKALWPGINALIQGRYRVTYNDNLSNCWKLLLRSGKDNQQRR